MFVFQSKLELIVGTPAAYMDLELFSTSDKFLQKLDNNEALLGSYHVDDDCRIHVGTDSFLTPQLHRKQVTWQN